MSNDFTVFASRNRELAKQISALHTTLTNASVQLTQLKSNADVALDQLRNRSHLLSLVLEATADSRPAFEQFKPLAGTPSEESGIVAQTANSTPFLTPPPKSSPAQPLFAFPPSPTRSWRGFMPNSTLISFSTSKMTVRDENGPFAAQVGAGNSSKWNAKCSPLRSAPEISAKHQLSANPSGFITDGESSISSSVSIASATGCNSTIFNSRSLRRISLQSSLSTTTQQEPLMRRILFVDCCSLGSYDFEPIEWT
jgi:hypothetical protein